MNEKPNYYAILPAEVRYDTNLKDKAKLLYAEIVALSNKEGYCWASNSYFANLYEVNKNTISRLIQDLTDRGYIKTEIKYKEGTKEIESRYIQIGIYPYIQNGIYPIYQNVKENNININNINNNIYKHFENVFTRTLNFIEYKTMENWLNEKSAEEIINAINEAAKSNVDNIKYIEKILFSNKKKTNKIPDWFNKELESTPTDNTDFQNFLKEFRNE